MNPKKKVVINYEDLEPEVIQAIMKKYPSGYANHVVKVNLSNNKFFHAITVDTEDTSYLVKVKVKLDKIEKLEEDLFSSEADRIPDEPDTDDSDTDTADDSFTGENPE
ncbi:MAG: hypothetical protein WBJ84_01505 [Bacteroidales bacterium]